MTLTYEQAVDLLPAYAIGALEAEEKAAVEEYLRLQKELIKSLTRTEAATTLLAQGSDHAPIAPDAQARMMERISTDLSNRGLTNAGAPAGGVSAPNQTEEVSPPPARPPSQTTNGRGQRYLGALQGGSHLGPQENGLSKNALELRNSANRSETGKIGPPSRRPTRVQHGRVVSGRPRSRPPADLFPPPAKRKFMGGIFNTRALINATMVASLVTLLFMSLLNLQSETQLRQLVSEVQSNKTRLTQTESQVIDLNTANVDLSKANSVLISQSSDIIEKQAELTSLNLTLSLENERVQTARTELLTELNKLDSQNREISIERATLFEENTRLQNQLDNSTDRITLLAAASQTAILFGTDEAPNLQGTFIQTDNEAALVIRGLEPLPANQTYQFWLVTRSGRQVSAGLFQVDEEQEPTWAALEIPQSALPYTLVGVTIEPAGGSDTPTGEMLLESIPIVEERPDNVG